MAGEINAPPPDPDRPQPIVPDEPAVATEVPIDHPAFGSMPMLDMEDQPGIELDAPGDGAEVPSYPTPQAATAPAPSNVFAPVDGAGEELDLDDDPEELMPPRDLVSAPDLSKSYEEGVLVGAQIAAVQAEEHGVDPDFTGNLASRTVAKVLFRFAIVEETGLLVLTGPRPAGKQAEYLEWINRIQTRAQATITSTPLEQPRTAEIHLMQGKPHLAAADRSEEALVAYLLATEELSEHRVELSLKNNPHRRPISALLAAGAIAPLQVSRHVTAFVLETVHETFCWDEGEFAFYREREASEESFPTGKEALDLVRDGVFALPEAYLERYFQRLSGYNIVVNRTPPVRVEQFGLDPVYIDLYRTMVAAIPLDESLAACAQLTDPLRARQALHLFIECELASLV